MPHPDWNQSYIAGDAPWDTGVPDNHLVEFVHSGVVVPGKALEIGCGTGANALRLARQGFKVLGIDVASIAIEKVRYSTYDIVGAIEPALEIMELRSVHFRAKHPQPAAAWLCLSRLRKLPAVSSTQPD